MLLGDDPELLAELYKKAPAGVRILDGATIETLCYLEKSLLDHRQEMDNRTAYETKLRDERNQLQNILDSLPDAVLVLDETAAWNGSTARFEQLTGIPLAEVVRDGFFIDPFTVFEEGQAEHGRVSLLERVRQTGEPVQFIHFEPGDESGREYFRVIITPFFDQEGRLFRVVETIRPITDVVRQRRLIEESEGRFRQFINHARDFITIKDLAGRYLVINEQAAALFEKSPRDYIGKTDHELLPANLADRLAGVDRKVIKRREYLTSLKTLVVRGNKLYLDVVHFPLFDYQGEITGVGSISRDVTEQHLLQKMLVASEKMAAVGKLAASVAHEINNPLTGVLSFAEEMKIDAEEKDPEDPAVKDLEVIIRETMRCREIVSKLLDYARLEPAESQPLDINTVLERSAALVRKQAMFQDVTFTYRLDENLPAVRFIPNQMQQVLLNLIINAAEAMNHSGTITLSSSLSADGRFVEAGVMDDGPGIPAELFEVIFEPFYSTKGSQGTGQGLSVVRAVVEQHGGRVGVSSQPGRGTSFTISLPLDKPDKQENWV